MEGGDMLDTKEKITTNSEYVLATEAMLKLRCGQGGVCNAPLIGLPLNWASFSLLHSWILGWGGLLPPGVRVAVVWKRRIGGTD